MWVMASRAGVGVLLAGIAVIAACGDDGKGDASSVTMGSARGARADAGADDASGPEAGRPVVRVIDGGGQGAADASGLDGGLDASLLDGGLDASSPDGGLDASLDGSISDAMPSPMPIEDAALDARAGPAGFGGFGGFGGNGGVGGTAGVGGF
jgi:hypothetical protein